LHAPTVEHWGEANETRGEKERTEKKRQGAYAVVMFMFCVDDKHLCPYLYFIYYTCKHP
jgi:hypothetical protein